MILFGQGDGLKVQRDAAAVDLEDFKPPFFVRDANLNLPVKPASAPECGVDIIRKMMEGAA
jgi:hypothetical protein